VQAISRQRVRIIGPEHIEFVLNESVYQEDYFETVWGQAPPLAKLITTLVGGNGATMKEIQQLLRQRDIDAPLREINTALDVLELYSVFVRRSERYHFAARAFPEMLQRAYGNDLDTNIELLREEYRWKQQTSSPQVP